MLYGWSWQGEIDKGPSYYFYRVVRGKVYPTRVASSGWQKLPAGARGRDGAHHALPWSLEVCNTSR